MPSNQNRYSRIIEKIFSKYFDGSSNEISFSREDIINASKETKIKVPKNIGDVIYSFRYRVSLPDSIKKKAPKGLEWIIRPAGRGKYKFALSKIFEILPSKLLAKTKILDSTPGIIDKYALSDEQALLAKIRYNRLIDIFTGVTCYSLQSHLRTSIHNLGQVETDEVYVGVDQRGALYVFPIQAKGGRDKLGIVQIEQDFEICRDKFPNLICRPIAAQFLDENSIALFAFEEKSGEISVITEKHYSLVPPDNLTNEELNLYKSRPLEKHLG